jgi:hypothetical protein
VRWSQQHRANGKPAAGQFKIEALATHRSQASR